MERKPNTVMKSSDCCPHTLCILLKTQEIGHKFCRNKRYREARKETFRTKPPPTNHLPARGCSPQQEWAQLVTWQVPASSCIASPGAGRGEADCRQPCATTPACPQALPAALLVTQHTWLR